MASKMPKPEIKSEEDPSFIEPTFEDDWGDMKKTPRTPRWSQPVQYESSPQTVRFDHVRDVEVDPTQLMESDELKETFTRFAELHGELAGRYILLVTSNKDAHDTTYGVTYSPQEQKFRLGNLEIDFDPKNAIHLGTGHVFQGTQGVFELLFLNKPDKSKITEEDLETYRAILQISGVHKVKFDPNGRPRSSKAPKYTNYISKLFPPKKKKKKGKGLIRNNDKAYNYVYFDDPNELVERLALLHASAEAGNSSLGPEVASIVEELYELGLIARPYRR